MPTKVTKVTKAPAKTPAKAPGSTENPARKMKVLKAYTVAYDSDTLIADITKAFDKHKMVAVTVQNDKALDRKMQQRIQSIAVRRGLDKNIKTAVDLDRGYVTGCAANPDLPLTEIKDPATPRAPKTEKVPAKKTASAVTALDKAAGVDPKSKGSLTSKTASGGKATTKAPTTRKATTKRRTPAQEAYQRAFGSKDAEKATVDDKAAVLAAKEAEAAAAPQDIVINGTTVLAVVQPDHDTLVAAALEKALEEIAKLPIPLPAGEGSLRIGKRGDDPVIETNYGQVVARPRGQAVAVDVLKAIEERRTIASTEVA